MSRAVLSLLVLAACVREPTPSMGWSRAMDSGTTQVPNALPARAGLWSAALDAVHSDSCDGHALPAIDEEWTLLWHDSALFRMVEADVTCALIDEQHFVCEREVSELPTGADEPALELHTERSGRIRNQYELELDRSDSVVCLEGACDAYAEREAVVVPCARDLRTVSVWVELPPQICTPEDTADDCSPS